MPRSSRVSLSTLALLAIVAVHLSAVSALRRSSPVNAACKSLNEDYELKTRSQLNALAEKILNNQLDCLTEQQKLAIKELNLLIDENDNVCTQEKADRIRDFHLLYLVAKPGESKEAAREKLPTAVRQFFIGYALRVSQKCRPEALDKLLVGANKLLKPADFELVNRYAGEKGMLAKIINEPSDYNGMVLPKTLVKFLRSSGHRVSNEKVFLQVDTVDKVAQLKLACEQKFRPIYGKVMPPLLALSSVGYNFNDQKPSRTLRLSRRRHGAGETETATGKQVFQWFRIVFMCETLDSIELVSPDPETKNVVKILTKKEADELHLKSPELFAAATAVASNQQADGERIIYEPRVVAQLDDVIIEPRDRRFTKEIKRIETKAKKVDSGDNFMKKLSASLKEKLAKKAINFAVSKRALGSDQEGFIPTKDLIKVIDDYVYQLEIQNDSAVAEYAVAFVSEGKLWKRVVIGLIVATAITLLVLGLTGTIG